MTKPTSQVRPIGARALKSAIDTLRPYLASAKVLDLYAGQGRFGEAAMREGASVTFVERDANTARALEASLGRQVGEKTILIEDCFSALEKLSKSSRKFDIVFADPPYPVWNSEYSARLFAAVSDVLTQGAIFLVKHPSRVVASDPVTVFKIWKSVRFGEATLIYCRYGEPK